MNVGLFFGSFNPIHNGHINIAQDILDSGEVDEIWMVLSPKSPDKNLILDVFSRYSLMQIALDNMHNIEISKIEFDMPTPNYTYHTLIKLSKKFPKIHFKIIMGQDNYDKINSWKEYKFIIDNYKIIIYPREKKNQNNNFKLYDVSSSDIRNKIRKNISIKGLVPKRVEKEILKKKFYIK